MARENLRIDGMAAVIPYVEGANNQLEVAERIRNYIKNLMRVVLE
ncbi:hypothetical protein [Vulcanisaeta sp. JCM 16159]